MSRLRSRGKGARVVRPWGKESNQREVDQKLAEGNNAEIATGGSAGVAAAGISPEGKRGVQKGAAGDHGKLLRGQSVSGAAAAKAGVGGAVRDAGFQAGDGKFMGTGKCPHGWSNWLICAECNPKGDK